MNVTSNMVDYNKRFTRNRMLKLFIYAIVSLLIIGACLHSAGCGVGTENSRRNASSSTTDTNHATSSTTGPTIPLCGGEALLPVDEGTENASFAEFRKQLLDAIERKDVDFLREHIHENIRGSFGEEGNNIESFLRLWKLDSNPQSSDIWNELEDLIKLGGTFSNEQKIQFFAPYIYTSFPERYDAFTYAAVIKNDAKLYASADKTAEPICELRYNIVELLDQNIQAEWRQIRTTSGKTGYVLAQEIRSPVDYRAQFQNLDGTWKMTILVAGD